MRALRVLAVGVVLGLGAATPLLPASDEPQPEFVYDGVPVRFVDRVTNRFFPLTPGTKFFYEGWDGRSHAADVMFVTYNRKRILGVDCTVVRDQAFVEGVLTEQTLDWYAQDAAGNVWYFGEDSRELDADGSVISTHGSWEAGRDGARPGIIMKAHPEPGDRYMQEVAPGVAEDAAAVRSLGPGCVPFGCFDMLLATDEWTRLAPGVLDRKLYARDVGFVEGRSVKGGDEYLSLVRIATVPPPGEP